MSDTAAPPRLHLSLDAEEMGPVQGTVQYPYPGGDIDIWTLGAVFYADAHAVAAGVQAAVRAATGSTDWLCEVIDDGAGGLRLRRVDNFTFAAAFPLALQAYAGWAPAYTSPAAVSGSVFGWWPSLPLDEFDVDSLYRREWDPGDDDFDPLVVLLASERRPRCTLQYEAEDVGQLRLVLAELLRGRQFRLWAAGPSESGWEEDGRDGYLDLKLIPTSAVEQWVNEPTATLGALSLECVQVDY